MNVTCQYCVTRIVFTLKKYNSSLIFWLSHKICMEKMYIIDVIVRKSNFGSNPFHVYNTIVTGLSGGFK